MLGLDAALAVVYFGTTSGSGGLLLVGGILFVDAMGVAWGATALPMGRPLLAGR